MLVPEPAAPLGDGRRDVLAILGFCFSFLWRVSGRFFPRRHLGTSARGSEPDLRRSGGDNDSFRSGADNVFSLVHVLPHVAGD